jgi:CHAT domain-containing protein
LPTNRELADLLSPRVSPAQSTALVNRDRLNQLQRQLNSLIQQEIQLIDPSFSLSQKVEPISFQSIQQLLPDPQTAILEWYISNDAIYTFVITVDLTAPLILPTATNLQTDSLAEYKALVNWANQYLTAYSRQKDEWQSQLSEALAELAYILKIDQLLAHPALGKIQRLILIPHRFLHLFPLHVLPVKSPNSDHQKCLLDRFPLGVSYAPSCQLLQLAQKRERPDLEKLFALQNPTNDLVFTDLEVEVIRQFFHPHDLVMAKKEAHKTALNNEPLTDVHCVHLSCHGYFNVQNPLYSGLLLAGCKLKPAPPELDPTRHLCLNEDEILDLELCLTLGNLFSREIDLSHCRLATLSACETGIIDTSNLSDEYIGLPSGFLFAGAASVVSSLWTVDDLSTAFLMIKFYQNLKNQPQVALALNQAQLWLRDSTKAKLIEWIKALPLPHPAYRKKLEARFFKLQDHDKPFQNPFHWAAFCDIGQ